MCYKPLCNGYKKTSCIEPPLEIMIRTYDVYLSLNNDMNFFDKATPMLNVFNSTSSKRQGL